MTITYQPATVNLAAVHAFQAGYRAGLYGEPIHTALDAHPRHLHTVTRAYLCGEADRDVILTTPGTPAAPDEPMLRRCDNCGTISYGAAGELCWFCGEGRVEAAV